VVSMPVKILVHTQTVVRGLLREVNKLASTMEKAEERLFNTILDTTAHAPQGDTVLLQSLFEEKQSLITTLEGLYAAKFMLESLDSLLESLERPERIPVVLTASLKVLENAGQALKRSHEAESLYIRIVRAELEGLMASNGLLLSEPSPEADSIVETITRGALQQARTLAMKRAPPSPILGTLVRAGESLA